METAEAGRLVTPSEEEPIIVAETVMTRALYGEFSKATFRKYSKRYTITNALLGVFLLAIGIGLLILGAYQIMAVLFIVFALFIVFSAFFGYIFKTGSAYKQLVSLTGENCRETARFYENKFTVETPRSNASFDYEQITSALKTEHLLCLMLGKQGQLRRGIAIDKCGFIKGSCDELMQILIKKRES